MWDNLYKNEPILWVRCSATQHDDGIIYDTDKNLPGA